MDGRKADNLQFSDRHRSDKPVDVFLHQGSPGQTVGGKGAYTKGEIYLAAGQEVYIYVGEAGGTTHSNYIIPSTFNGAVRQDMIKAPPSDPAERAAERRISGLLRENGKIVTQGGASGGLTGYEGGMAPTRRVLPAPLLPAQVAARAAP